MILLNTTPQEEIRWQLGVLQVIFHHIQHKCQGKEELYIQYVLAVLQLPEKPFCCLALLLLMLVQTCWSMWSKHISIKCVFQQSLIIIKKKKRVTIQANFLLYEVLTKAHNFKNYQFILLAKVLNTKQVDSLYNRNVNFHVQFKRHFTVRRWNTTMQKQNSVIQRTEEHGKHGTFIYTQTQLKTNTLDCCSYFNKLKEYHEMCTTSLLS